MFWRNALDSLQEWAAARDKRRAVAEFTCAQCERSASCGRPPSDDCVEKLDQIERNEDWRYRPAGKPGQLQY